LGEEARPHPVGGVVHHHHQYAPGAAPLKPVVVRPVQLHHRPKARLALAPLPVLLLAPTHGVCPFGQPPAPQRLVIHHQLFLQQLFSHQRQAKIGVAFLGITSQCQRPQFGRLAPRAGLAAQPMHHARIPIGLIPFSRSACSGSSTPPSVRPPAPVSVSGP